MKSFATRKFRTTRGQKTFLWGTHTYWGLGDQREKTTKVKVALFQRKVASNARKLAILIWTAYISDLIRRHECNTIWCQILRQRCHITRHCNNTFSQRPGTEAKQLKSCARNTEYIINVNLTHGWIYSAYFLLCYTVELKGGLNLFWVIRADC